MTALTRRRFVLSAFTGCVGLVAGCSRFDAPEEIQAGEAAFEITKTDREWRRLLSRERYYVLRKHDTEPPGSSPLNTEHRRGVYHCAGCDLPLFASDAKFESGTGWPSFTAPIANAVGTSVDRSLLSIRIEVHCRRCGGHLGHVFNDGPPPTGQRYCMNGLALVFRPA